MILAEYLLDLHKQNCNCHTYCKQQNYSIAKVLIMLQMLYEIDSGTCLIPQQLFNFLLFSAVSLTLCNIVQHIA